MSFRINFDVSSPVRYDQAKLIEFFAVEEAYDLTTSLFAERVEALAQGGTFKVTSEEGRLDLISYRIYSKTSYWYILSLYNRLTSHEKVVVGMELRYPTEEALENLYFQLKAG